MDGSGSRSSMWSRLRIVRALMALPLCNYNLIPMIQQNGRDDDNHNENHDDEMNDDDDVVDDITDQESPAPLLLNPNQCLWYRQRLQPFLKREFGYTQATLIGSTSYHISIEIIESEPYGKVLFLDGKFQCAQKDEFVYHECLVHPALLIHHHQPRSVFIMGGGDGCTAREVLKHRNIQKVILCDIDEDVVLLLKMTQNVNWWDARDDQRLQLIFQDAKGALENTEEKFDVIVGDVGDQPIELGHPNHLYTKSFYENVVKPKLNPNGIFVTHAGPAGVLSHKDKFSPVYNTLKQVFTYVGAYTAHVPSYADTCGWVMASDEELRVDGEELNTRIGERIDGELFYLDGPCIVASTILNKTLKTSLMNETKVITEDS